MPRRMLAALAAVGLIGCVTAGAQTGTFIDRVDPADLRIASFNVYWDTIFPDVNPVQAAKFDRLVNALDPDILNLQEINRSASAVASLMDTVMPLSGGATWRAYKGYDCVIVSKYALSLTRSQPSPAGDLDLAMALVDLPDDRYQVDVYIMNNHYKCCGGYDYRRQKQSDALVNWMRDARGPGGVITLPEGTPMLVVGDLNIVDGPGPLNTLITGDIFNEAIYGPDSPPDWDVTASVDAHPYHNVTGADDYTWRDDGSSYDPGRLDFIIYTDSAAQETHKFVLNTVAMSAADLAAAGLERYDVCLDSVGSNYDHLPIVADFCIPPVPPTHPGDCNCDDVVNAGDIPAFITALTDPTGYPLAYPDCDLNNADINEDGSVNAGDIPGFVGLLTGG